MTSKEKFIADLGALWDEIGYTKDQRKERVLKIHKEIGSTLERLFNSEREEKIQLESNAAKWADDIVKIAKRLGEPIPQYDVTGKPLLERLKTIQTVRNTLIAQKDTKEDELKGLLNSLTMTIKAIGSNGLQNEKYKSLDNLSDQHIQEIRTYANDMAKVRDDIITKSQQTISDIKRLCEDMSEAPSELTCSLDGSAAVTAEQLSALTTEKKRLATLKDQRAREIERCLNELRRISAETGTPEPGEVEKFAGDVLILSAENVRRCQSEVSRQNEVLKEHIKGQIRETIGELKAVWDDIDYESRTIDVHGANFDTKTAEGLKTLLNYYKTQLKKFEGLKDLTDSIIKDIEERNEIIRNWEYLSSDEMKSHLTGRTSEDTKIRLSYMRAQSKLSKIPRIEGGLLDKLTEWKELTNTCFMYDGIDYIEKIQEDEAARKENPVYKNTKAIGPAIRKRRRSTMVAKTPAKTGDRKQHLNVTFTAPPQQKGVPQKGNLVNTLATPGLKGGAAVGGERGPKTTGGAGTRAGNKREANLKEMPKQRLFAATTATTATTVAARGLAKRKSIKRKSTRGLESHKPLKKSRRLK